jgi:hypothetical protein
MAALAAVERASYRSRRRDRRRRARAGGTGKIPIFAFIGWKSAAGVWTYSINAPSIVCAGSAGSGRP